VETRRGITDGPKGCQPDRRAARSARAARSVGDKGIGFANSFSGGPATSDRPPIRTLRLGKFDASAKRDRREFAGLRGRRAGSSCANCRDSATAISVRLDRRKSFVENAVGVQEPGLGMTMDWLARPGSAAARTREHRIGWSRHPHGPHGPGLGKARRETAPGLTELTGHRDRGAEGSLDPAGSRGRDP
jgi:hypothetical protein